jgi:hypothetical protein
MPDPVLVTLQVASRALGVAPHPIKHHSEAGVVEPAVDPGGRGSVRRFGGDDLLRLSVAVRLQDLRLTAPLLRDVMRVFDLAWRHPRLWRTLRRAGLLGTVRALATSPDPGPAPPTAGPRGVALHICFRDLPSPSAGGPAERLIALQAPGLGPAVRPAAGYALCSDADDLGPWVTRVALDLSVLADRIAASLPGCGPPTDAD